MVQERDKENLGQPLGRMRGRGNGMPSDRKSLRKVKGLVVRMIDKEIDYVNN